MKIVLGAVNAKYIHSNLAVYSLRAYAKEYHEEIEIAEYTINQQIDEILMDLYKRNPDILCFSCYIWNLDYIQELVKEVHKILPNTVLWLGGPEVSYDSEEVLTRLPEVTGVMKGEGEKTFRELMKYYHGEGENLSVTDGITYRTEDGRICVNQWRPVMDLSEVPFVYDDMSLFRHKIIYYETSRGCPFRCSYCLSSVDKCLRFRRMDLVKKELQYFLDQKVPQVKFVDRTFNCRHDHAMEIWNYIYEHDNGVTNFHFEVSADLLNEDELKLIGKMRPGLIQLEIGVQSTNPDTIREIHRTMDFEKLKKIVLRIEEKGNVHQHLDLIAGLPYEDYKSFGRSFNDVYELKPEQLQLGFLKVLKGSYMQEHAGEYGLVYKDRPPYEVLSTNWLSYGDIVRLKQIEEIVEVYYNSGQFSHTLSRIVQEFDSPFSFFESFSLYYEMEGLFGRSHTRIARYEHLLHFIRKSVPEKEGFYKELLIYDLYLRENVKNRPDFAGEERIDKKTLKEFYDEEEKNPVYLKDYGKCDSRKLRKMTHMEKFFYRVNGGMEQEETLLVFDYQKRNPLNHEAAVMEISCKNTVKSIK
nr:B12-binding domain-containing radical SAM protein [uncultured Sellimonas sp.]